MPLSETLCLSKKMLLALYIPTHAIHAVYTFSSPPQDVLMVKDIFSRAVQGLKHCLQTSQASHTHVTNSVPTVVVKQEGGFYEW